MRYKPCPLSFFFACLLSSCLLYTGKATAQIIINNTNETYFIRGSYLQYYEDKSNNLTIDEITRARFESPYKSTPNFGLSKATYWLRFRIKNLSDNNTLLLEVKNPTLTNISLYNLAGGKTAVQHSGESIPFSRREIKNQNPVFIIPLAKGDSGTYYIQAKSRKVLSLPMFTGSPRAMLSLISFDQYIFGIYTGIILIMLLYNFFIYLSIKDKDYLYYIFYITCVGLAQAGLQGYAFRFLWPDNTWLAEQSTNIFIALSGISSLLFVKSFLNVKKYYRVFNVIFNISIVILTGCIINNLAGNLIISQQIIQIDTFITSILIIVCGLLIQWKGSRSAIFFNISWLFFVTSVIIYVLKDAGILPYNNFTSHSILIGSAIEIALLSFALADKINGYKKEKELSQAAALQASLEKEQIVKQQNVMLESKVKERTQELEQTNVELNGTLDTLKKAESQLVHAEKMASLGQLTAGIAHEINNPINFVKSNVTPLKMDIHDLMELVHKFKQINQDNVAEKLAEIDAFSEEINIDILGQEITELLAGIEEGSTRTVNIVKGLRTFSRVDEDTLKPADVHEGINATMTLLTNMIPSNLTVIKDYGDLPLIECYPGKLNQVFMNILTNAIQAITSKTEMDKDERITITTINKEEEEAVTIRISDTGTGIAPSIRNKIFDPFFTTKDVGEGVGLGLSIVFSIIQKHHGHIDVISEEQKGSEFIITLPVKQLLKD